MVIRAVTPRVLSNRRASSMTMARYFDSDLMDLACSVRSMVSPCMDLVGKFRLSTQRRASRLVDSRLVVPGGKAATGPRALTSHLGCLLPTSHLLR